RALSARRIYRPDSRLFHVLRNRQSLSFVSNSVFLRASRCQHDSLGADGFDFRFRAGLVGVASRSGYRAALRIKVDMQFGEIITMALSSLGVNKLRSGLTMLGITFGVFSFISVMTAIGALQYSIENGLSFLGSNFFQFVKYPANVSASGDVPEKFRSRQITSYQQAVHLYRLMLGVALEVL